MADLADLRFAQGSLFEDLQAPLFLDEYQDFTSRTDQSPDHGIAGLGFVLLGLFGEVGSLLSALKKKRRDSDPYGAYRDSVVEEFGDVLWYFSNCALRIGLSLTHLAQRLPAKLEDWSYGGVYDARTFADLQPFDKRFSEVRSSGLVEHRLLALAGKTGLLLQNFSSGRFENNGDAFLADLVEIFRALVAAADDADISLEEAARRNIAKTTGRWPVVKTWTRHFDENFSVYERLPRRIALQFTERNVDGVSVVVQEVSGKYVGDPLTDNSMTEDDYRFHDIFHLSYATFLGWSPTLRLLLKVKRKSDSRIDEVEDGARARIIEEGVSTWIFNHAARNKFFLNVKSLDYSLLKSIHDLVTGYEVARCPAWQWETAILEGYRVFRELRKWRGGTVRADLDSHILTFEAPEF